MHPPKAVAALAVVCAELCSDKGGTKQSHSWSDGSCPCRDSERCFICESFVWDKHQEPSAANEVIPLIMLSIKLISLLLQGFRLFQSGFQSLLCMVLTMRHSLLIFPLGLPFLFQSIFMPFIHCYYVFCSLDLSQAVPGQKKAEVFFCL